jgi:hypothetical protein
MALFFVTGGRRTGTTLLYAVVCADIAANPLIAEAQLITRMMEVLAWAKQNFAIFVGPTFPAESQLIEYFRVIIASYAAATRSRFDGPENIVFKNPEYCLYIHDLVRVAADARFIITVRDPRDQVTSELEVGRRQLERGMANPAAAARDVGAFARTLNTYYAPVLASSEQYPDRFIFIKYEDLLGDFPATLLRLNNFTGMRRNQFDPAKPWPRVHAELSKEFPSSSEFYHQPFEPSRIGRYRRALSTEEIKKIEQECAGLMSRFGYDPSD